VASNDLFFWETLAHSSLSLFLSHPRVQSTEVCSCGFWGLSREARMEKDVQYSTVQQGSSAVCMGVETERSEGGHAQSLWVAIAVVLGRDYINIHIQVV
jgi:hypothetical protein